MIFVEIGIALLAVAAVITAAKWALSDPLEDLWDEDL